MKKQEKKSLNHFGLPKSQEKIAHLNIHFESSTISGSKFSRFFINSIEDLMNYINTHEPNKVINQDNGTYVYIYENKKINHVGYEAIASINDIDTNLIRNESRNGHTVKIAVVNQLPITNQFCVVAYKNKDIKELITAFPGRYAPPFPHQKQLVHQNKISTDFWNKHILLKLHSNS